MLTVSQIFAPIHVSLCEPSGCIKFSYSRLDVGNRMIKMSCVFVVVILQNFINKQWIGAPPADKTDIRQFLNEYLLSQHKTLPTYIRNKLVKVIVDIGRVDWPHFYPNFFSNIIEVLIIFWIMCGLGSPRPICRSTSRPIYRSICWSTYWSMLDRYVGRRVGQHIGRGVSVDQSTVDRYVGRHVDRRIGQGLRKLYMIPFFCSGASTYYSILALGKWARMKISLCGHYSFSLDSKHVQGSHNFAVTVVC